MRVLEIREATGRGSDCPRYGAVDTDDDLTAEDVYCLAADARPGVGMRAYRDCATGTGDTAEEAERACMGDEGGMKMAKHTEGPWTVNVNYDKDHLYGVLSVISGGTVVGIINGSSDPGSVGRANARLMAEAPNLLAALKAIVAECGESREPRTGYGAAVVEIARKAIAQVEGKEQ